MACVNEVKKLIVKKRLNAELGEKRLQEESQNETTSIIEKLADLAKTKVSLEEFSAKDRLSLLDLFVNTEEVLL